MKTRCTRVVLVLGLGLGLGFAFGAAAADEVAVPDGTGPIPAPPGPYQSSRPYLGAEQGMAYHGAMQFPFVSHERPYFGPGRYWAPADGEPNYQRDRFATRPMAPWGPPRFGAAEAGEAVATDEPVVSRTRVWQPPVPPPVWWQPPTGR